MPQYSLPLFANVKRTVLPLSSLYTRYGTSVVRVDVRSSTVGICSGKPTFHAAAARTTGSMSALPDLTYGGCFGGVRSTGVGVSSPEHVCPTIMSSIAPFRRIWSALLCFGMGRISDELKSADTRCAARRAFGLAV